MCGGDSFDLGPRLTCILFPLYGFKIDLMGFRSLDTVTGTAEGSKGDLSLSSSQATLFLNGSELLGDSLDDVGVISGVCE